MNGKCAFIFLYDMGIYCNLVRTWFSMKEDMALKGIIWSFYTLHFHIRWFKNKPKIYST